MTANAITPDEVARIRGLLAVKPPEPTDCEPDCEHIECGFVVACERHTAEQARLARTLLEPLLDALEHAWGQEKQTALTLDGFLGDLEKARDARVPLELKCPKCDLIHVDADEFATKPHRTHLCLGCGNLWRPYPVATIGVDVHAPCRARRDELLELCAKITREAPYSGELEECKAGRAALIAEVGTLRSQIANLEEHIHKLEGGDTRL